eukprot:INCI15131.1.p1 GENE.INCI15131.1~~INCI15131.1.p1  ORF type:complete len:1219 (-),score=232.56 INCI15131.1:1496-5152(-)
MFIYLSKKIAIPKGIRLKCVSWNSDQGWVACGGESGLLKVLKLDSAPSDKKAARGVAAPSNLSMNQTLEGHSGPVMCVTWNANYRKLTTSDGYGLIIVWMLHKGMWFEEMINNRNKSTVSDMKWTSDGQKICIIYEDGAVIVGSVDGNRMWGKDLNLELSFVEWSPDGRNIIFVTKQGEALVFDGNGNKLSKIQLHVAQKRQVPVIGIHWYDGSRGHVITNAPTLAIAFQDGKVQLIRGPHDDSPVLIDTGLQLTQCRWNHNGSVLALAGTARTKLSSGETRDISMVQFYLPTGQHLNQLKVPGSGISALSWEGTGLRIALGVGAYIYFANIRPDYKWGHFLNTLVYSYQKLDRPEQCVNFWHAHNNEKYTKYVKNLLFIRACGTHCALINDMDDGTGQYAIALCNAIGAPVQIKYTEVEPLFATMTTTHIIVASTQDIYVWQYDSGAKKLTAGITNDLSIYHLPSNMRSNKEAAFHIDETNFNDTDPSEFTPEVDANNDPISCITASDKFLLIGRSSGSVHRYTLPYISLENKYALSRQPKKIALNCISARLGVIDTNGHLTFLELEQGDDLLGSNDEEEDVDESEGKSGGESKTGGGGRDSKSSVAARAREFSRKDTWDMVWADDDPDLFVTMEKTRMFVFHKFIPEDPVLSSGYLSGFNDLQIKAVLLDEVMEQPSRPAKNAIVDFDSGFLREVQERIKRQPLQEVYDYIDTVDHSRLWALFAEKALGLLDFGIADKAFVRCEDYRGIQFVKKVQELKDVQMQKAEIAAYFERFEEAEEIYREMDRKDLAIELKQRMGDWFRVVQLIQGGGIQGGGDDDDEALRQARNHIGDFYRTRQKWDKAAQYYAQAENIDAHITVCFRLQGFDELQVVLKNLPEADPRLKTIGSYFQQYGLHEEAVRAFLKFGDVKAAIDCCVLLNRWGVAVELAEKHKFPQIQTLLAKYANHILQTDDIQARITAVRLYRKANKSAEAGRLLTTMAKDSIANDPLRAKKLYVLAGLELERYRVRMLNTEDLAEQATRAGTTIAEATLAALTAQDAAVGGHKAIDKCWQGAEALHYLLNAQRMLYEGRIENAMQTALHLVYYDDILEPRNIYSLIAVTAYYAKYFSTCSKAFVKLTNLKLSAPLLKTFDQLALAIFLRNAPDDPQDDKTEGVKIDLNGRKMVCMASGEYIYQDSEYLMCKICHNYVLKKEMETDFENCPLCHSKGNFREES